MPSPVTILYLSRRPGLNQEAFERRTKAIGERLARQTVKFWHDQIVKAALNYPEIKKERGLSAREKRHRLKVIAITIEGYILALLQSSLVINGIDALDEPRMVGIANEMYVTVAKMIQTQYPKLKLTVAISNTMREGGA